VDPRTVSVEWCPNQLRSENHGGALREGHLHAVHEVVMLLAFVLANTSQASYMLELCP